MYDSHLLCVLDTSYIKDANALLQYCSFKFCRIKNIGKLLENVQNVFFAGNVGLIRDQRYRTDPDAGMPMPD
jgi:hypothetical protein